jgi:hypothetical protein
VTGLQGQPLSAAIAKLGMPNEERVIADQKVYIWYTSTFDEGISFNARFASSWPATSSARMTSKATTACATATLPNCEAESTYLNRLARAEDEK